MPEKSPQLLTFGPARALNLCVAPAVRALHRGRTVR